MCLQNAFDTLEAKRKITVQVAKIKPSIQGRIQAAGLTPLPLFLAGSSFLTILRYKG
jgi:hypothetical protein